MAHNNHSLVRYFNRMYAYSIPSTPYILQF